MLRATCYALASLQEVKDYLRECHTRGFIDQARLTADLDLLEHTKATSLKFMKYHEEKRRQAGSRARTDRRPPADEPSD